MCQKERLMNKKRKRERETAIRFGARTHATPTPNRQQLMATALSLNGSSLLPRSPAAARRCPYGTISAHPRRLAWPPRLVALRVRSPMPAAAARADDSSPAPQGMSLEAALRLLGVSEGASFDDILRAKNAVLASCKDDQDAAAQVEAAYDMLLMQSFSMRRAGKVANSSIRYADVKPVRKAGAGAGAMPQWMQSTLKNIPVSVEAPTTSSLGIQSGVYGTLMVLTYVIGSSRAGAYSGADVPGYILGVGFGASLYFLTKKKSSLGKATLLTAGALVAGAVVGSIVESWLHVEIVPFLGIHSPAVIISEFVLVSQLLASLYLR